MSSAGETHRVAGRGQRSPDERPDAAEGALQHAEPQRHLAHQPHQAADHRERRVSEQQQLLDAGSGGGRAGRGRPRGAKEKRERRKRRKSGRREEEAAFKAPEEEEEEEERGHVTEDERGRG